MPITDIIVNGNAELFPEVTNRGYFDIDFRDGKLVLTAKNYIGIIPINERVSIHVTPRFPINNVLYLVQKAKSALRFLPGHFRGYTLEKLISGDPEKLFASTLLNCLLEIERNGLMRRYQSRAVERGWRGRLLIAPTVARFVSRGDRCHQVREITELTVDLDENRFIKDMLKQVARYFLQQRDSASRAVAQQAATLLRLFDRVSDFHGTRLDVARNVPRFISKLPGDHKSYEQVLWLCYLIATRQGITIESFGPTRIESMIINLADVFEAYARQVVADGIDSIVPGGRLRDGNKNQVSLFTETDTYKMKPDFYLQKGTKTVVVLDAKYKFAVKSADRYEVIAFCEGLQSKCAIFLLPTEKPNGETVFLGTTSGGIQMYEVYVALGAADILKEEVDTIRRIREIAEPFAAV